MEKIPKSHLFLSNSLRKGGGDDLHARKVNNSMDNMLTLYPYIVYPIKQFIGFISLKPRHSHIPILQLIKLWFGMDK